MSQVCCKCVAKFGCILNSIQKELDDPARFKSPQPATATIMAAKTCSLLTLAVLLSLLAYGAQSTVVSAESTLIFANTDAPFELDDGTKLFIKGTEDASVSPPFFLYHNVCAHHLTIHPAPPLAI